VISTIDGRLSGALDKHRDESCLWATFILISTPRKGSHPSIIAPRTCCAFLIGP
jgi:hypothetical protein